MMRTTKRPAAGVAIPALLLLLLPVAAAAQSAADSAAVRRAALDYIEGWYEGNPDRMRRAVHDDLAKRIVSHMDGRIIETSAAELVGQVERGGGSGTPDAERRTDVRILDLYENAASVRVTAHQWVDYMHLARVDGRWRIMNVLWELTPEAKRMAEASAREAEASGAATGAAGQEDGSAGETFREEFLRDFGTAARKFVALAEAMPGDTYGWRPMEGVASPAEVFVHVARYNYWYPESSLDVAAPEGIDTGTMEETFPSRGRAAIIEELERSMTHVRDLVTAMDPAELEAPTRLYGRDVATRAVLLQLLTHMHEHLGQSIAYARMNGVVPPWSR